MARPPQAARRSPPPLTPSFARISTAGREGRRALRRFAILQNPDEGFGGVRVKLDERFGSIGGEELFRRLATGESVYLLDVRTEAEFTGGHIPGSVLIPFHDLETQAAEVPNGGTPVAVVCSHGIRSLAACRFLAELGISPLFNLRAGLDDWPGPLSRGLEGNGHPHNQIAPSRFLVESYDLLPRGIVLDLAMGNGRNAIYLASRGFDVDGVDIDPEAVAQARATARRLNAPIRAVIGNVEDGTHIIPLEAYDVILVFNYLHRPVLKDIRDGVRPGGVAVYQTYTTEQPRYGKPTNPAHLLEPGELKRVFADWQILRYREGVEVEWPGGQPRALAGIAARKPA